MLTFSKTVRTMQLDILNNPHLLADKISMPRHNSINATFDPYQLDKLNKPHSLVDEMF